MTRRWSVDTVVLMILVAGALLFVLLLAGVGSGLLTSPSPYVPPH